MLGMVLFIAACVTINVYFPSAAAEQAADRIIRDVYGEESNSASPAEPPAPESSLQPSGNDAPLTITLLNWLAPPVQAAANINIQSPAITALRASMKSRFTKLKSFYENGGVGMTQGGLIKVRDLNAIALRDRKTVTTLVADENRDRNKLYLEIARANGHPEWEADIRKTFASRWIENAPAGWWYQDAAGQWKQK
jgi:uncharacterized protein YdbL (DUF1318 family)